MQSWSRRGTSCLFCTWQPLVRPVRRSFSTSPILERSKRKHKKDSENDDSEKKSTTRKPSLSLSPKIKKDASADFQTTVTNILNEIKKKKIKSSDPGVEEWERFSRNVMNACQLDDRAGNLSQSPLGKLKVSLRKAYARGRGAGLRDEIEYLRYSNEITTRYSAPNLDEQKKVADLRYPAEWYPQARTIQRTIHLHVGPTNSGKTYHALQRLQASGNGFYAGPLRLLAQEVYHRFKDSGVSCSLVTGDDVKIPEGTAPLIVSNTVEMVNLGRTFEVGVIDEIQMIADRKRGWAWTKAVLGARVKELHLCGEARAVPLIRELAALTGDKLEIHRYERLNPLKVAQRSLCGDLNNLRKGDCLVSFSRVGIHALKGDIEKVTGKRAAIVYGGLPAEIRTQQANLFNDPNNDYDFLVASDAIGMGLNLSCKRIIFETLVKRIPGGLVRLSIPEIKQIAGRAGRYRSASQQNQKSSAEDEEENVGWVTSMEEVDLPYIHQAMGVEPAPIMSAGIIPPEPVFEKFGAYFPRGVPLEYIIKRLIDISQVHPLFFMCDADGQLENTEVIDAVKGLQLEDQMVLMASPMDTRDALSRQVGIAFAECVARHTGGRLLDIPELNLEILEEPVSGSKEYLHGLELLHRSIILYLWLSFRFGGVFTDRTLASHVKELAEERMVRALTEFSANKKLRKDASLRRQIALQKQIAEQRRILDEEDFDGEGEHASVDLFASQGSLGHHHSQVSHTQ
ncbi:ATP-dependent RNA helicase SUV3 [Aspergillus taichungensis]|uniref:RNA helicase n=1 Tax=Aspergillus taichungensis TaxID=482145 RepID=A0A2J5I7J5_9EURO|nr:ATP-dependent RNA helicase SUV3 [Aspergillus taichungensis]